VKKVIVTGGRFYRDFDRVFKTLIELAPDLVIEGGATGADRMARDWAIENGIPFETFNADWATYGKMAGRLRNRRMLFAHRDAIVVAFPGNSGTEHCVETAKILKHTIVRVR
jgi:predicted Rossmann-fold nucleotide-binding protein